jgi:TolA-binding protein
MRSPTMLVLLLLASGCVLDRTGQSASEIYRRELALQGAAVTNLESQFDNVEGRLGQMEELNRAQGQEEILKMETLEQVRGEVARLRGEVEVLQHNFGSQGTDTLARQEDASFRLLWLEQRADQLERSLGLETPAAPEHESPVDPDATGESTAGGSGTGDSGTGGSGSGEPGDSGTGTAGASDTGAVTDPAALIKLAEEHLAAGREPAAEAVLDRFLELHPKHKKTSEVLYRKAEAAFNAGRYAAAVLRFQEVIDGHKKSPWAPWAMLRQGECFEAQGQKDNAKLFYEDVARIWPKSKAAGEARKKLK